MLSMRVFAIALAVFLVLCSVEAQRRRGGGHQGRDRRGPKPNEQEEFPTSSEGSHEGRRGRRGPPPPCRVLNGDGVEIKSHECPRNLTCAVGPISKSVNGSQFSIYLCTPPPSIANRMVHKACKVQNAETSVILSMTNCRENRTCSIGPFSATVNDAAVTFFMCDRPHRRPHGRHPEGCHPKTGQPKVQHPQGHRPCRVLDADKDIVEEDDCPSGMDCTRGPKELRHGPQAGNTGFFCELIEDIEPEVGPDFAPLRAFELDAEDDFDDDMSSSGGEGEDSHEEDFMGRQRGQRGPKGGKTARGSRRRPF